MDALCFVHLLVLIQEHPENLGHLGVLISGHSVNKQSIAVLFCDRILWDQKYLSITKFRNNFKKMFWNSVLIPAVAVLSKCKCFGIHACFSSLMHI